MTEKPGTPAPAGPAPGAFDPSRLAKLVLLFALSGFTGWVFEHMGAPLPWMIGPLFMTAAVFMWGGFEFRVPLSIRPVGQMVVASQVGLTFSPAALQQLLDLAPVIVGTALMTGVCVFFAAILLSRFSGLSLTQAFLAGVPTSPVEAASMAMKAGADPMPVVFSQTLRMSAVVVLVPFALYALEGWPDVQRTAVGLASFDVVGVLLLAALGFGGAYVFRLARIPNPNFLGPLTVTAVLAASGYGPAPFPAIVLAMAQVILGTWLGSTFRRQLLVSAGRLTVACAMSILLVLVLCSLGAVLIAMAADMDWHTLVLGAAPGGVVEMALTAKFLGQNVALITSFHLARIFILMPNIPWIVALIGRYEKRASRRKEGQT